MRGNSHGRGKRIAWTLVLVLLLAAGAWLYLANQKGWKPFKPPLKQDGGYQLAVWEWRAPDRIPGDDLREYMDFADSEKIRTVYLDISSIIDINELSDPGEKANRQTGFDTSLRQFVQEAHRHGIRVHGLAGSVQWSDPDYRYMPLQVMDYVAAYNSQASLEERLDGVQFDIEFYNQDSFDNNKRQALQDFLETASRLQERLADLHKVNPSLQLGFAIPYWYDNENGNLPAVSFKGTDKPVGYHLMDILNAGTDNYVVLMDYRDKPDGKNGSIEQASNEVGYAQKQAKNVRVVIGQLVSETKPVYTTFYDDGKERLYTALAQLQGRFDSSPNYAGLAIHDYKSFKKLVED